MPNSPESQTATPRLWMAYVIPMALFMLMTAGLEPYFPKQYVWVYVAKVVVVTAALIACRAAWQDIRFETRALLPGVLVGLTVFVEWIVVSKFTPPLAFLGTRAALNPFASIPDPLQRWLFLAFRFFGLAVMVPIMEELFWRSFLLRYITNENFTAVPMGTFSGAAFAVVALAFGFAHPEWLAAILCAIAYGLLLKQTRSLFACIVAHGVTNLALGIYVLVTHDWRFW